MFEDDSKDLSAIDPLLQKPPPRRVEHRRGLVGSYKLLFALLTPPVWIGLFLLYAGIACGAVPLLGQEFPATVTNLYATKYTGKGGGYRYWITYSYTKGTESLLHTNSISSTSYQSLHLGENQGLKVRWLPGVPAYNNPIVIVNGQAEDETGGLFLIVFAIIWNIFVFLFIWFLFGINEQLRCRFLTRFGTPAAGQIINKDKAKVTNAQTYYYILYKFVGRGRRDGKTVEEQHEGRMRVTYDEYYRANIGDTVSVLFNSQNPKQSLIYEFDQYRVV